MGNYFVCGKAGHHAPQCRHRAKNDYPPKENLAEGEDTIVAVISQVNLVTNVSKWVVDSGLPHTFVQTKMCLPPDKYLISVIFHIKI